VFLQGSNQGDRIDLDEPRTLRVGRDPACDIRLHEDDASRLHAILKWDGETLVVEDCGSRNGVFVNGVRTVEATLRRKDLVVVAGTVLSLEVPSEAGSDTTAALACPRLPELAAASDYHRVVEVLLCIQEIIAGDRDDMLERSVEALFGILPATRLSVLESLRDGGLKQIYSATEGGPVAEYVGRSFAEHVLAKGEAVLANDASSLEPKDWGSTMRGQNVLSAMGAPVHSGGRPAAVLICDNLEKKDAFGKEHLDFLEFAARGLEAIFQRRDMREMQRRQVVVDRQLTAATLVQRQILNRDPSSISGLTRWRVHHRPALEVGGDFFDFHHEGGTTMWVLADVSGKGVPAALVVSMLRAFCKTLYPKALEPAAFLNALNHLATGELSPGMFFTALAMRVDAEGTLLHAAAGQDGALIARASGSCEQLPMSPALLGMPGLPEDKFHIDQHERKLRPGDRVMVCTDGVTEAGPSDDLFGTERALDVLCRTMPLTIEGALTEIVSAVLDYEVAPEPKDDITVIIGQRDA
jgi:serine phosphatase RsbU (regulator of sigma subunit)